MSSVYNRLKATGSLPTPSGVAIEILRLCRSESTTLQEIAVLIEKDPALTGRILKHANSAASYYGRTIVALSDAVVSMGTRSVQQLALSFSLLSRHRGGLCQEFDYPLFWSRSLVMATAARALIHRHRGFIPDEVFSCGLLCEVGRLALATVYPQEYSEILAASEDDNDLLEREQTAFSINHRTLTEEMLSDWGIPSFLISGIKMHWDIKHTEVQDARMFQLAVQMSFASKLADICLNTWSVHDKIEAMKNLAEAHEFIGDLDELYLEVIQSWEQWSELFELPLPGLPSSEAIIDKLNATLLNADHSDDEDKLLILAADDDPGILKLVEKTLSKKGHTILTAESGEIALKLFVEYQPQLVLTDWNMRGEMSGLELCRALNAATATRDVYLIMLTSCNDEAQVVEAFDAGVDDYIIKPVTPRMLDARVSCGQRLILQEVKRAMAQKELESANQRLEQLAMTDALTGLPNRRHAMERIEQNWAEAVRNRSNLSCILIDIDFFKRVNDTFGHDVGDLVLCDVALVLKQVIRTNDIACRIGGEEMLIICNNTDLTECIRLADRLRKAIENHSICCPNSDTAIQITVSLGVAALTEGIDHYEKLIKAADDALFISKQQGRNRVSIAEQNTRKPDSEMAV